VFDEVELRDGAQPYRGPRGVFNYSLRYVSTLESLATLADDLIQRLAVPDRPPET
jgi:hypothetical protein